MNDPNEVSLHHPYVLKPNATIAVVAPAGIPDLESVALGIDLVESWGYRVVRAPHIGDKHRFAAGTIEARASDLVWALSTDGIDAVWYARGGYGTVQLVPHVPYDKLDKRVVIGCSDATALLTALDNEHRGTLVHGPMLAMLATRVDDATRERMRAMLAGETIQPLPCEPFVGPRQTVQGRVVGGNLCVLASLAGTPWALRSRDAIVVLEDIDEAPYRIDRLITQLRYSGALDGAVGIALGDFTKCDAPKSAQYTLEEVLADALEPLGLPVWSGVPTGHGERNLAWFVGAHGELGPLGLVQKNPQIPK